LKNTDTGEINSAAGSNRGNILANTICAELPSVITTLNRIMFKPTLRQWNAAMRTIIPQCKHSSVPIAAEDDFLTENFLGNQFPCFQLGFVKSKVPQVLQEKRLIGHGGFSGL
jgi:hypothetical protein